MYNDLWKRSQNLEALLKEVFIATNSTRYELQESMHSLIQPEHNFGPPTDGKEYNKNCPYVIASVSLQKQQ